MKSRSSDVATLRWMCTAQSIRLYVGDQYFGRADLEEFGWVSTSERGDSQAASTEAQAIAFLRARATQARACGEVPRWDREVWMEESSTLSRQ